MRRVRRFYWRTLRRWHGEICQDCGRKYFRTIWLAPEVDWLNIVGSSVHLLCPGCYADRALAFGKIVIWRPEI